MIAVPHKVAATTTPLKADDRYAEAGKLLRKQLSDDKVYEAANAWALKLCTQARRYNCWATDNRFEKKWPSGSAGARKMADHLERGDRSADARISAAEKQSGIKLNLNAKNRGEALAKWLRAFSEQQPNKQPSRWRGWTNKSRNIYGPLLISFHTGQKIEFPAPTVAVAAALAHGFQEITACFADGRPVVVERFSGINHPGKVGWSQDGKPCWSSAVAFASAAVNEKTLEAADEFEAAAKKRAAADKLEAAVKQWLKNHRGRILYWGFDE
jgi:hypothetical protein